MLETPRLRLRPLEPADADLYARWHADEALMEHMGRGPLDRAESDAAFARHLGHWHEHGFGLMVVEEKETGLAIGRSGVHYHRLWPDEPEVGWLIEVEWQGRGLATEAGAATVAWAFAHLECDRLVSICTPANIASRRVMEKLGFEPLTELPDALPGVPLWVHAIERGRGGAVLFER
jgi:RimJ/RimL family protein N-acetyltransferase